MTENPALSMPVAAEPDAATPGATGGSPAGASPSIALSDPLPSITTPLTLAEVQARLDHISRRGRLAGYTKRDNGFSVDAFGNPFECDLIANASPVGGLDPAGPSTLLTFTLRRRLKVPLIFAIALLITVEPGQYFLDQLIPGEWNWIDTRLWYYPLAIIPIPFIWRTLSKRSNLMARVDAHEQIAKIEGLLKP